MQNVYLEAPFDMDLSSIECGLFNLFIKGPQKTVARIKVPDQAVSVYINGNVCIGDRVTKHFWFADTLSSDERYHLRNPVPVILSVGVVIIEDAEPVVIRTTEKPKMTLITSKELKDLRVLSSQYDHYLNHVIKTTMKKIHKISGEGVLDCGFLVDYAIPYHIDDHRLLSDLKNHFPADVTFHIYDDRLVIRDTWSE